jgi:asparagine synthase (glutamine-hydrolysing)
LSHYIVFIWDAADTAKSAEAIRLSRQFRSSSPGWSIAIEQPGLLAFFDFREHSSFEVYPLGERRGVVLGRLFEKRFVERGETEASPPSKVAFGDNEAELIVRSGGRHLIDSYWGQYVAFLSEPQERATTVLRDPTGGVPCQRTVVSGIDVYFVRLEDLERVAPVSLTINSHYLLGYLFYSSTSVNETGLNEIETVLAGECITHRGTRRDRAFLWNPLQIANTSLVEDSVAATRFMRQAVEASVHAWASCFDGVLHRLSGGLDSSIVLACLARAPSAPRIVCVNLYDNGPDSDERLYARRAAEKAGCELLEQEATPNFSLDGLRSVPKALSPFPCTYDLEETREDALMMKRLGLKAQFNGHSGDEIFLRISPLPTAVDYYRRRGARSGFFSTALGDAQLERISFWAVLKLAWEYGALRRPWDLRQIAHQDRFPLMRQEVRAAASRDPTHWHPLFRDASDVAPGKYCHAYTLTFGCARGHVPNLVEESAGLESISPLRSQPLLELSLRTPTYVLKAGGRDRAIARAAFQQDLPPEIYQRKTKGHGDALMRAVVARNIGLARELLLDGFLVRESFLDRPRLEKVLSQDVTDIKTGVMELLIYLCVEAWALSWRDNRLLAAA